MNVVVPSTAPTERVESRSIVEDSGNIVDWISEGEAQPTTTRPSTSPPQVKQCPYCAETIQLAAQKCRFCGEFLDGRQTPSPIIHSTYLTSPKKSKDPGVAAVLSFVIPGLGQIYNGRIVTGIIAGALCILLYFTIIFGLLLHIFLVYDAYSEANRFNQDYA